MINFESMIDNYLKRDSRPKEVGRYYPSEIGNCLRKVWFSYTKPKAVDPNVMRIFEVGNIMHGLVVDVLKSEKNPDIELLESESPLRMNVDDFVASGRIDDIIVLRSNKEKMLIEAKSCKSIKFVETPNNSYIMQLQFYMHATGIHKGVILYIEKNTLKSKVFPFEYDKVIAGEIINRFRKLNKYLKENKIPPQEAKQKEGMNWMCNYCMYKEECNFAGSSEPLEGYKE